MTTPKPCLYTLLFFIFLIHANSQSLQDKEVVVLLKLKSYWLSPPALSHWTSSSNSSSHCSWPEITCTENSVTGLVLYNVNLTLQVPPFICDLNNLTHLDLGDNYLPGDFPLSLYNCSKLEYLDLSKNYFVGTIPDDIDKLPKLQTLILAGNNFSGDIPASIGKLQELTTLHLYMNQFNGSVPAEIGNLSNLEFLWLSWLPKMAPWKLPFEFTMFKKMKTLKIREANLIGEIPESVGEMEALEELDMSINNLSGKIPSGVLLLKHLSIIYLFKNRLSGEIPQVVEAFNLTIIDISENNFTGPIPQGFGNLTKLTDMSLFYNDGISGEIPEGIGLLPNLVIFKMFNMNLSGTIPPEFGKHSPLEDFQVSVNRLTGKLPDGLCKNGKLVGVVAYDNSLTGGLPSSLENCDSLLVVTVYDNKLSGDIPSGMWNALNLTYVLISNNSLTGELPEKMSDNLLRVEIADNKFSGQIPRGVSSCKKLQVFDARKNLLNGTIPQELTTLPSLSSLLLHQNRLSGPLPSDIVSWESLNILDLSRNQLSGPIPEKLGVLPSLTELDLSENQFSGEIPNQFAILKLNNLNLSSNLLTGEIPTSLENSANERSFLNNTALCASTSGFNVNICSRSPTSGKISNWSLALILSLSAVSFLLVLFLLVFFVRGYRRKKDGSHADWKLTSFQRCNFTLSKILAGLTEGNVIGSGGSGKVYRVPVNRIGDVVAAKRIWTNKNIMEDRLEKQFLAEVKILSSIRHANIVKLMCCISSESSKLLVYEYSDNRSLDRWLHKKNETSLSNLSSSVHHVVLDWPKRLQIAVGAADGLCYMHHDCVPPVIHRDVKSSNILLDSDFNAKIADFGLAKMLVKQGDLATMSAVAGSFGYMAPEYAHSTRVNGKIDVYSFGVVLLELTTGREPNEGDEHTSLAEWAWRHGQEGKPIADALDQDVKEPCYMDEMNAVFKLGIMCTEKNPSNRPSMREVLHILVNTCPAPVRREKTEYAAAPLLKNSSRERVLEDQDGLATDV
ncbi:PREDICTED: receptor-like protein kinase HSL1 [Fragaria vesca subsp. vesca]|uniref:receptor-like protein kinase HSL1 n=1 Tax=Fragaria vesca subsp. vesca TaxID=101020 RepID=UPI0002C33DC8|nr:PREDICTED: receptor-like protein kinase HSL1 [Fragaria vesca subsp. vesca]